MSYLQVCSSNIAPEEHTLEADGIQTHWHFSLDHIMLFIAQALAIDVSMHSHAHLSIENRCLSLHIWAFIAHWQPHVMCLVIFARIHISWGCIRAPDFGAAITRLKICKIKTYWKFIDQWHTKPIVTGTSIISVSMGRHLWLRWIVSHAPSHCSTSYLCGQWMAPGMYIIDGIFTSTNFLRGEPHRVIRCKCCDCRLNSREHTVWTVGQCLR